jgi:DNA-binding LacI/PurR family transcriptional regulator
MRHRSPADPRRPTLDDVAKVLGLSQQTVSRVINKHPRVLPETRERVLQAIDAIGYKPNQAARFLANRRSTLIGLVTDDPGVYGPAHAILSLEQEARLHGYTLMIFGLRSLTIADAKAGAEQLIASSAEGLIVDVPVQVNRLELAAAMGDIPFVTLDIDGGELFPSFRVDHIRGSRLATRHLISLGHTRIAGLLGHQPYRSSKLRRKGWLAELQAAGLEPGPARHTPWTPGRDYDDTKSFSFSSSMLWDFVECRAR